MLELFRLPGKKVEKNRKNAERILTRRDRILYSINVAYHMFAALAQSVERRLGKAEVGGSIPLNSLLKKAFQNSLVLKSLFC